MKPNLRNVRWTNVHFRKTATHPMQLILVERLDPQGKRTHRPLWLIATGDTLPTLEAYGNSTYAGSVWITGTA